MASVVDRLRPRLDARRLSRKLTIPPELAYGSQGSPPDIGPDETLVFVIDLLDAR